MLSATFLYHIQLKSDKLFLKNLLVNHEAVSGVHQASSFLTTIHARNFKVIVKYY